MYYVEINLSIFILYSVPTLRHQIHVLSLHTFNFSLPSVIAFAGYSTLLSGALGLEDTSLLWDQIVYP